MKTQLYLMMGYPGSGKTTASKIIARLTGATHLWADHIRREYIKEPTYSSVENRKLYNSLNEKTGKLLTEGNSVVFDTNFNFYNDRERLRKIAAESGASCVLIWVQVPKELAQTRSVDQAHLHSTRILGAMAEEQFKRLTKNLQPPKEDEHPVILDGTKITPQYIAEKLGL